MDSHLQTFFLTLPKVVSVSCLSKLHNRKECFAAAFEILVLKAKIKKLFYCCYGNLLFNECDNNVFTNDPH